MNYLFWNTNRNEDINSILKSLITGFSCDIVGLAEYNDNADNLIKELSKDNFNLYHLPIIGCSRINILTKYPPSSIETYGESEYYTIKKIPHETLGFHLVAFVHLPSKLCKENNSDREEELRYLKGDLEEAEEKLKCTNSIIVGDFNMNPFEEPMVSAKSVHSLLSRDIAKRENRIVQGRKYSMFYNPTWNLLGDSVEPIGTYYYQKAEQVNYFWNIFDQVIIRPALIDKFDTNSLKIINRVGGNILVDNKGRPQLSDHLPLYFSIK